MATENTHFGAEAIASMLWNFTQLANALSPTIMDGGRLESTFLKVSVSRDTQPSNEDARILETLGPTETVLSAVQPSKVLPYCLPM